MGESFRFLVLDDCEVDEDPEESESESEAESESEEEESSESESDAEEEEEEEESNSESSSSLLLTCSFDFGSLLFEVERGGFADAFSEEVVALLLIPLSAVATVGFVLLDFSLSLDIVLY